MLPFCWQCNLHDVGSNHGLVVLPPGDLTQVQQISDDRNQESVLLLLQHGAADGANRPTERVEAVPRQLSSILQLGLQASGILIRAM